MTGAVKAESSVDSLALFGASFDYSERRGTLDFGNGRTEDIDKSSLFTGGVMLGKRWKVSRYFRLQAAVNIKFGSVVGDTLPPIPLSNGSIQATQLKTSLFYSGCIAEIQYPIKVAPDGQWFLSAGGGLHVARVRETETLLGDANQQVTGDPYAEEDHVAFSASIHGGLGFEIIVSPLFGIAAAYSLRYWYPVHYGMTRDYFPVQSVPYSERFLSHEFNIIILVKR